MKFLRLPLILILLLALSGCMSIAEPKPLLPKDTAEFDILTEAPKLPFGGTVEDLQSYDSTAELIFSSSYNTAYYMGDAKRLLGLNGILLYFFDANGQFAEVWYFVPNATSAQYFETLEQLSELTEGPLHIGKIDGDVQPLEAEAEAELRQSSAVAPELMLETYTVNSLLKDYEGASLGLNLRGADHILLSSLTLKKGTTLPDPLTSEMVIRVSPPPEV